MKLATTTANYNKKPLQRTCIYILYAKHCSVTHSGEFCEYLQVYFHLIECETLTLCSFLLNFDGETNVERNIPAFSQVDIKE